MTRRERLRGPRFSVGGVLGKGFSIWGRSLPTLVVLMLLIYSPLILYQGVLVLSEAAPEMARTFEFMQPGFWIERLLNALSTAAVMYTVFQRLRGTRSGIGEGLRVCVARLLPLLGTAILFFVATNAPTVPWFLIFETSPALAVFVGLLGVAVSVYLSLMFWVAIPAVVVEGLGPVAALKRSIGLTHGYKGQIFVINNLVVGSLMLAAYLAVFYFVTRNPESLVLLRLIVTLVLGALAATVTAVGYHDLRRAKEGIGVDELLRVFA